MELYPIEEAQREQRNGIVKNGFTEEEAGRCIAIVSGDETNSAARKFSRSVYAGTTAETRQSAPHECWAECVSSAAKRYFNLATVGTRGVGFRETAKVGF
jgi:hypothetical protein